MEQEANHVHLCNRRRTDSEKMNLHRVQDALVVRLKTHDDEAAAELVDMFYEPIYLFMRRLGHDRQTSEDLTQETFLKAWQHIDQLRNSESLNGWIYRIAVNASRLFWRRHGRKGTISVEQKSLSDIIDAENNVGKAEHIEQLQRLKAALTKLPWKFKEAIVLHYLQQLTIAEAAEVAGIRIGTFKSRLNRALKALRKQMV